LKKLEVKALWPVDISANVIVIFTLISGINAVIIETMPNKTDNTFLWQYSPLLFFITVLIGVRR
jgi:hypothetical protein